MDEYGIYKLTEFITFMLYLIFIFLMIQIWLLWRDIDINEWRSIMQESFFKKSLIYIFCASIFFIIHEFLEGMAIKYNTVFFEIFEVLAVLSLVLFAHSWYKALRPLAHKKSIWENLSAS